MRSRLNITLAAIAAVLTLAAPAAASPLNSIQPARLTFGAVPAGQHPNRLATLHNGTGHAQTIASVSISGAGGYVFTTPVNTPLLEAQALPTCRVGLELAAGARCAIDVRVHTTRAGWWRAVLSVRYRDGWFNSGQLEAHVTPAP